MFASCARRQTRSALSLFGVNPLLRFADGALAAAALKRTPFVVVSELFMTETAQAASLLLPARAAFEKDGHDARHDRRRSACWPPRNEPPLGTLSDAEMLVALAAALER